MSLSLSQASTPAAGFRSDRKERAVLSASPTPSGPFDGAFHDSGTQTPPTIVYYPPLFKPAPQRVRASPRSAQTARPALGYVPQTPLLSPHQHERVEYAGHGGQVVGKATPRTAGGGARQRPSSAPVQASASTPASSGRRPGTSRSRRPGPSELSWRIDETRKGPGPARDPHASLLRSRITLGDSGMDRLKQLERDALFSSSQTQREAEAESRREARTAQEKQEKERVSQGMAARARFLAHVPPSSPCSEFKVMSPDLYEKWAPRTVAFLYGEGLTKRAMPAPVVMTGMSLPLQAADFAEKQASFTKAIADCAGVPQDHVNIDKTSGATRVDVSIQSKDDADAAKICSQLTMEAMNTKLAVNGLPRATLIDKAAVRHPGFCVLDFLVNTAHLPHNVASSLVPNFIAHEFTTRRKIFSMTDEDLRACGVSQDKVRQQIMVWIQFGDGPRQRGSSVSETRPVQTSEAYVNMKKAIGEIRTRPPGGAESETIKYSRMRCLAEGDAASEAAYRVLGGEQSMIMERVSEAKDLRATAADRYSKAVGNNIVELNRTLAELKHQIRSSPRGLARHNLKAQAKKVQQEVLKDNAILEMTQRKINLLDQAIADSECTQRALQEFELEDGVAIVDKIKALDAQIEDANKKTLQAGLTSALQNIHMLLSIEVSATVAATAAANIQEKQEHDLKEHFSHLKHRFHVANQLEMVSIVDTPDIDSEQEVKSLLSKNTLATDPVQAVLLHQLESQKEAIRKNEMEVAKVLKWVQEYEPFVKAQEEAVAAAKPKPTDHKAPDQDRSHLSDVPPAKPTSVHWANKSMDLNTKINTFLTGIAISNRDLAREKLHEITERLARSKGSPAAAAMAAAVEGVLRDLDEKLEDARLHADVKYDPEEDEEKPKNEEAKEDDQKPEDEHPKGPRQVDRRAEEAQKRAAKEEAEAAEAHRKAEAKRKSSIALRFSREKLWHINFHSVQTLRLFSFSKEQIAKARESEQVQRAEEQVTAAHQKISETLEGVMEGCRIHCKKERAATAVALAAAAAQKEVSDKLDQQVHDLEQRILCEQQDPTVQALKAELKQAQQDARDIASIFSKVGQCPGPKKTGDDGWCWQHCCNHEVTDPFCPKWIKQDGKFHCCGGNHWVCKKGDRLFKAKG